MNLMALILHALKANGPTSILESPCLPHALAANFHAAGFAYTDLELWTHPTGGIQQYLKQILLYLHQLPELTDANMDKTLSWLTHLTGVHYKHLMPKMLPPSVTPSPTAAPPPAPQPTYASSLASPTPAEARNTKTPRYHPAPPTLPTTPTPPAPTTGPRVRTEILPSTTVAIRNLYIHPEHRPIKDPETATIQQPQDSHMRRYLRAAKTPEALMKNITKIQITPTVLDMRVSFATDEIAKQFLDHIKKRLSGFFQQNMHGPGRVRPNIYYYHKSPAHLAARQAVKAARGAENEADFTQTFAALEIADRVSDASKATTKSLHQARTYAKRVHTIATKFPNDETLAAAVTTTAHLVATAMTAVTRATAAAAANDADAAISAAACAANAATTAREVAAALPKMTFHSNPTNVDPARPPPPPPTPPVDQDAMEVAEPTHAPLVAPPSDPFTHQGAPSNATIAPAPTPQDPPVDMYVATTSTKRPSPPSPPRPPIDMDVETDYYDYQREQAARATRQQKKKKKSSSLSSSRPAAAGLSPSAPAFNPGSSPHPSTR